MDAKTSAKQNLAKLLEEFAGLVQKGNLSKQPEQMARTWAERFLKVFGWDASDPRQVRQEYRIQGRAARRLRSEGMPHVRPDYCLISNYQDLLFIDVKKFEADLKEDSSISFQVRCYGWSKSFKVSYAFSFCELAVYDCRVLPSDRDEADVAQVLFLRQSQYLEHFDALWDFFGKEAIDSGSLSRRLPDDERPKGVKTLDEDFEEKLLVWRKELAKSILRYGKVRKVEVVSAAAQRIIDRIVFLRICEAFGFEELGALRDMARHEDGFWPLFLEQHEERYGRVYDGILFPASKEEDPTKVDYYLRRWWLKGKIFRQMTDNLYYPYPYRFDVIPLELLGGIYERYLGKRLRIVGHGVADEYKPEYQKTKGAVYTPPWVVTRVVAKTLAPLIAGKDPEEFLGLTILDPACGSAGFLLGAYDYFEKQVRLWFAENPGDPRRPEFVADTEDGPQITAPTARRIITGCLYGVDIDAEAVEVARMSLALRYAEKMAVLGGEPECLLQGIGLNIKHGNSLVGPDIVGLGYDAEKVIRQTMPFDWQNPATGFGAVMAAGGFDAVVGNPPYIEVKRYKEWMPSQYKYLKESGRYETTRQGKTDVAMPFMELGLSLLREKGRLGFIIQNRFFKTDYGEIVRHWLKRLRAVAEIEDFRDLQVFKGRTTYTAILILQKDSPDLHYQTYSSLDKALAGAPSVDCRLKWDAVNSMVWSFDQPDLLEVYEDLARRHGTIGQQARLQISVGLQTLYGKLYQFEPVEVRARTVIGRNGEGDEVSLEKAALRPLCRNRGFFPFRQNNRDAWVIFPYDIEEGRAFEIGWREFEQRYPKTARYLEGNKKKILKNVETEKGANRWHLYRYPKNLVSQANAKVLFPMTIEDTMAAVDFDGDIYQDNVNINSISFSGASSAQLQAMAAVFNSTLFNALARLKAGLNDAGWRKFNRQYAELVPFPVAIIEDAKVVKKLSALADQISNLQEKSVRARTEGARAGFRAAIESLWAQLDETVVEVYGLTGAQKSVLNKYPRRVNRFDLLTRQILVPEDE